MKRKYHATWDEVAALDCDHIAGWGALEGYSGPITFDGAVPQEIEAHHDQVSDALVVSYAWPGRQTNARTRSIVRLERRPCPFGGARAYFLCPRCGRRALRLAVLTGGPCCGRCGKITWASRRQTPLQRRVSAASRLAAALDLGLWTDPPIRPRGMRFERYLRLLCALEPVKAVINREIAARIKRVGAPASISAIYANLGIK